MFLKRFLIYVFIFLGTYDLSFASLSISPLKHEFSSNPGDIISETIRITNNENDAITLYTSKEDFVAGDDSGVPSFIKPQDKTNDDFSLANWIKLENETITLAKGETREVRFQVEIPTNGEPGGHYGAIFFSPGAPNSGQVAVIQRLGVLILVNVSGDIKIDGLLKKLDIGEKLDNKFVSKDKFSGFPISFQVLFENKGNVHIKPTGKITLTDEDGNELKNIGKETILNDKGAFIGEKLVDYIPINDVLGNVLPKSERKFETIWEGFGYQELMQDGTKIVKFKDIGDFYKDKRVENKEYLNFWETIKTRKVNKKITAKLDLSYEGKDKIKKDFSESKEIIVSFNETYVGINIWIIIICIIILAGVGYYIKIIKPKKEAELKAKILEEIKNSK